MQPTPKSVTVIVPGATAAAAATASGSIDTLGYRYAVIQCQVGTGATASNTLSELTLSHNTSAATGGTALATGDTDFTIPTANVTTPLAQLQVDLNGRHRYLVVEMSPDADTYVSATCQLYKGATVPDSATDAGVGVFHAI